MSRYVQNCAGLGISCFSRKYTWLSVLGQDAPYVLFCTKLEASFLGGLFFCFFLLCFYYYLLHAFLLEVLDTLLEFVISP